MPPASAPERARLGGASACVAASASAWAAVSAASPPDAAPEPAVRRGASNRQRLGAKRELIVLRADFSALMQPHSCFTSIATLAEKEWALILGPDSRACGEEGARHGALRSVNCRRRREGCEASCSAAPATRTRSATKPKCRQTPLVAYREASGPKTGSRIPIPILRCPSGYPVSDRRGSRHCN